MSAASDEARVSFRFGSSSEVGDVTPTIAFARSGDGTAAVTSRGAVGNPFAVPLTVASTDATEFTLVVGSRAAVLVVDGMIVGAVEIDGRDPLIVEASSDGTSLEAPRSLGAAARERVLRRRPPRHAKR